MVTLPEAAQQILQVHEAFSKLRKEVWFAANHLYAHIPIYSEVVFLYYCKCCDGCAFLLGC